MGKWASIRVKINDIKNGTQVRGRHGISVSTNLPLASTSEGLSASKLRQCGHWPAVQPSDCQAASTTNLLQPPPDHFFAVKARHPGPVTSDGRTCLFVHSHGYQLTTVVTKVLAYHA